MSENVIDSLVVKLGLDSEGFSSGIEKSTKSLTNFASRLAGMFIAFKGLEGLVDYWKDLHQRLTEVGFAARQLGVSATDLSKWGEVSRLVGGDAKDAANSVQTLQASIFNLKYRGQVSDQLAMLQRFGVAYWDARTGQARELTDVARDAAAALDRRHISNQGERLQLAQSFGLSGGVAAAVAQGGEKLEQALAQAAKDQKGLSDREFQANVRFEQHQISRDVRKDVANAALVTKMLGAIDRINEKITELIEKSIPLLIKAIDGLAEFIKNPPTWLSDLEALLGPTGALVVGIGALIAVMGVGGPLVSALTGLAGNILRAFPSASVPVAAGISLGYGLDWLDNKYNGGRLVGDNSALAEVIGGQFEYLTGTRYNPNRRNFTSAQLTYPSIATPDALRPWAADSFNPLTLPGTGSDRTWPGPVTGDQGTSIVFENVTVNSNARDGRGLANDFVEATRRKMRVSNVDGGMQ